MSIDKDKISSYASKEDNLYIASSEGKHNTLRVGLGLSKLSRTTTFSSPKQVVQKNAILRRLPNKQLTFSCSTTLLHDDNRVNELYKSEVNDSAVSVKNYNKARSKSALSGKFKLFNSSCSNILYTSSICDDSQLISPSSRWHSLPRSYKGANIDGNSQHKKVNLISSFIDITDGETSGMGSSVDEPVESSTESASETSASPFQQPKTSSTTVPSMVKKRRGGWPKGTKRKPELQGSKAPKPKAPVTAYILYLNDRRKYFKDTESNLPYVQVFKLVGAEWSALPAEQKAIYNLRAEQEKKRYKTELQAYRQSPDYLLQLRKKRLKNTRKGATTTEESSDFTDEVDDDDSEELYCRICDQWFISYHNKRVHLRGKLHGKAVMGEYQRERKAEEQRQESPSEASTNIENSGLRISDSSSVEKEIKDNGKEFSACLTTSKNQCKFSGESMGTISTTEDDHDYDDDEDYDEDEEYDGEEEITEEEGGPDSDRVTDAAAEVLCRVFERDKEILWLRRHREKALFTKKKLTASLADLSNRQKQIQEEKSKLIKEEISLREKILLYSKLAKLETFADSKHNSFSSSSINSTNYLQRNNMMKHSPSASLKVKSDPWRIKDCDLSSNELCPSTKSKVKSHLDNLENNKLCITPHSDSLNVENMVFVSAPKLFEPGYQNCIINTVTQPGKVDKDKQNVTSLNLKMRCVKVKSLSGALKIKKGSSKILLESTVVNPLGTFPSQLNTEECRKRTHANTSECQPPPVFIDESITKHNFTSFDFGTLKSATPDMVNVPSVSHCLQQVSRDRSVCPTSIKSSAKSISDIPFLGNCTDQLNFDINHLNSSSLNMCMLEKSNLVNDPYLTNVIHSNDLGYCSIGPQHDLSVPIDSSSSLNTVNSLEKLHSSDIDNTPIDLHSSSIIVHDNITCSPPYRDPISSISLNQIKGISSNSNFSEFCVSPCKSPISAEEYNPLDVSMQGITDNLSLDNYEDKIGKITYPPIICEETFFKQFGFIFEEPGDTKTNKVVEIDYKSNASYNDNQLNLTSKVFLNDEDLVDIFNPQN